MMIFSVLFLAGTVTINAISLHNHTCQHQIPTIPATINPMPNAGDWNRLSTMTNGSPTFCGGKNRTPGVSGGLDRCVKYDIASSSWQDLTVPMLNKRFNHKVYQLNTMDFWLIGEMLFTFHEHELQRIISKFSILILGGVYLSEILQTEVYNGAAGTFTPGPNLALGIQQTCAVEGYNDDILLIGGVSNSLGPLQEVKSYNFATNQWTTLSDMGTKRNGPKCSRISTGMCVLVSNITNMYFQNPLLLRYWRYISNLPGQVALFKMVAGSFFALIRYTNIAFYSYDSDLDQWNPWPTDVAVDWNQNFGAIALDDTNFSCSN